jgi:hypothetical protein
MVPHGDRRDGTESRGAVDREQPGAEREDDIVRELVLHVDVREVAGWSLHLAPREDVPHRPMGAEDGQECIDRGGRHTGKPQVLPASTRVHEDRLTTWR